MRNLVQLFVNSLAAGGNYALAAIGYALVYSILKYVNFSHGSVAMVGAYLILGLTSSWLKLNLIFAFVVSVLLSAFLGVIIERIAYRPLRQRRVSTLAPLVTAVAVSFILEAVVTIVWGVDIRGYGLPVVRGWRVGPARVTTVQAIIIASGVSLMLCLHFLLTRTRLGKAIRAVSDNRELAQTLGLDVDKIISSVFAIGSALAAVAGGLVGLDTFVYPTMGFMITIKAFAAVALGGLGNVYGAIVGGFIIGLLENVGVWYVLGGDARWKESIAYAVLFLVLLLRPAGIFGSRQGTRVL